jgi:hypothetical protein
VFAVRSCVFQNVDDDQVRVVGFVLYLAKPSADKGLVITEVVLQGVGVSPLTLELSLVLLKWYVVIDLMRGSPMRLTNTSC